MDHERSGDVILISTPNSWQAYYWWLDDAQAPGFARTVDIHRKPGYDPVELFFDPATRGIPLDASLVSGSHGTGRTRKSTWRHPQFTKWHARPSSARRHASVRYRATPLRLLNDAKSNGHHAWSYLLFTRYVCRIRFFSCSKSMSA